jgi:hypothetical protein
VPNPKELLEKTTQEQIKLAEDERKKLAKIGTDQKELQKYYLAQQPFTSQFQLTHKAQLPWKSYTDVKDNMQKTEKVLKHFVDMYIEFESEQARKDKTASNKSEMTPRSLRQIVLDSPKFGTKNINKVRTHNQLNAAVKATRGFPYSLKGGLKNGHSLLTEQTMKNTATNKKLSWGISIAGFGYNLIYGFSLTNPFTAIAVGLGALLVDVVMRKMTRKERIRQVKCAVQQQVFVELWKYLEKPSTQEDGENRIREEILKCTNGAVFQWFSDLKVPDGAGIASGKNGKVTGLSAASDYIGYFIHNLPTPLPLKIALSALTNVASTWVKLKIESDADNKILEKQLEALKTQASEKMA